MKRLLVLVLLVLCVSGGTTAYSQITITPAECRTVIARLDTLNYLRAGNAQLQEMNANLELQCYQKDTTIFLNDSMYQLQERLARDANDRLQQSLKSEYKYRGLAIGCGLTSVLAIAGTVLIVLFK